MKTTLSILLLTSLVLLGAGTAEAGIPFGIGVSFGTFYSSLSPHGEWISVDGGSYAWRPMHAGAGWRPYLSGRWLWTDDGWYWDSEEPWAWATYHYGRWYYDDYYGWIWIPGYDWAPAWVEWRYGGDYIGWAPLGPYAIYNMRFGIHYSRHWMTPYHYWSFVDCRYMGESNIHRHVYRTEDNTGFIGRTRTAGNVRTDAGRIVTRGPERDYVEERGRIRVGRADVIDVNSRDQARVVRNGDRERIDVYRPRIDETRRDDTPERPMEVRERERVPSLDMRGTDLQRRAESREAGRDVDRLERTRPDPGNEGRPRTRDERISDPRLGGQREDRTSDRRFETRSRDVERPRDGIQQERTREREFNVDRMRSPERKSDRPQMEPRRVERQERSSAREPSFNRPNTRSEAPRSAPSGRSGGERRGRER